MVFWRVSSAIVLPEVTGSDDTLFTLLNRQLQMRLYDTRGLIICQGVFCAIRLVKGNTGPSRRKSRAESGRPGLGDHTPLAPSGAFVEADPQACPKRNCPPLLSIQAWIYKIITPGSIVPLFTVRLPSPRFSLGVKGGQLGTTWMKSWRLFSRGDQHCKQLN
jgi:hypothetical protein